MPGKEYPQESPELHTQVNSENVVQRYLPKQADLDKILKLIQKKALKGTQFPVPVMEIQAGYLISPYFKDVYLYLVCKNCHHTKLQ